MRDQKTPLQPYSDEMIDELRKKKSLTLEHSKVMSQGRDSP